MAKENVWLMETRDRDLAFAVYDELRTKHRGSWVDVELKVVGETMKLYAVPHMDEDQLQPGPLSQYRDTLAKWKSFVAGYETAWAAARRK